MVLYFISSPEGRTGSREIVLQALLVDPVVDSVEAAEKTLEAILEYQKPYLEYIR